MTRSGKEIGMNSQISVLDCGIMCSTAIYPVSPLVFALRAALRRSGGTQNAEKVGRYGYGQQHATPFCISEYLRNRPRAGRTTSQGAKLVPCHVQIASSGANHKPNPTGGAEGSEISGLPKASERTKTQRFKKKSVFEDLHQKVGGLYRVTGCGLS